MGAFSDNYYSWLDRQHAAEKAAAENIVADEWRSEDHPRGNPENKGQFRKSPKTIEKENKKVREEDDLSDSGDKKNSESKSPAPNNGGGGNMNGQGQNALSKSSNLQGATHQQPNNSQNGSSGTTPIFREVSAKEYADTIAKAKKECVSSHAWRVDAKSEEEYRNSKSRLVTDKGSCIAVQDDGDIVSLCKRKGDTIPATLFLEAAVDKHGDRLDTFEGNYGLYRKCGFSPISWTPFNVDFAPDGWKESGDKEEDIIFFAYTGDKKKLTRDEAEKELREWKASHKPYTGERGYDDAKDFRDEFLEDRKKGKR